MESWKKLADVDGRQDPVEIGEAFFEGFNSNRHARKKRIKPKTAVVGVKDHPTNKITTKPVPETTKSRLKHFIKVAVR